ncbi:hypothetical protein [Dysgonomonas sp. 25]|uniref:hypothetical protein n=1 Tax=Dysgonomonas sp. 25 TaxID=2302933 RepID=UPI0013D34153|nr:hypothetical protein [Dysgonomonas sp. 25]NDV68250.1 hypothetical protein [Dysgonomonas sp. 25]
MKRIPVLFLLFFFFLAPALAQVVLDAGPVDVIDPSINKFYYKSDDTYDEVELDFKWNVDSRNGYDWEVDYRETYEDELDIEYPVYTKNINKLSPEQFEKRFVNKKYLIYEDENTRLELLKLNKDHFAILDYWREDRKTKWLLSGVKISGYCYLKLGDKYIIKLLDEGAYIIPVKGRLLVAPPYSYGSEKIQWYGKARKLKARDLDNAQSSYLFRKKPKYKVVKTETGCELHNRFNQSVLPQNYDTVRIGSLYVIASKNNRLTIYNQQLKPFPIDNLRAVYLNDYTFSANILEAIVGNEHCWIKDGKVVGFADVIPWEEDIFGYLPQTRYTIEDNGRKLLVSRGKKLDLFGCVIDESEEIQQFEYQIEKAVYDNVYNDAEVSYFYVEESTMHSSLDCMPLIAEKDGKLGIVTIDSTCFAKETLCYTEQFPPILDKIEHFPPHFYLGSDSYSGLFLYKDGLIGLYPQMKKLRYSWVDDHPTGHFLRVTVAASGRQGWLSLQDGQEYLDE